MSLPDTRRTGRLAGAASLAALFAAGLALPLPSRAEAPPLSLGLPIACTPGEDCFVQNYVDHDPGPQSRDFTCGQLTYDGHKGTDFRLPDEAALSRDVAVLAAAPGKVLRIRDGMADISLRGPDSPPVDGKEAGNSVIIDHGNGWQSRYAHLRRGSILVEAGETVAGGTRIGIVGLSGLTRFPHLHFEVHHEGRVIDPYAGLGDAVSCGQDGVPLWKARTASALAYEPTGLLAAGLSGVVPTHDGIRAGQYSGGMVTAQSDVIVLWVSLFGLQQGDQQSFVILAPDGTPIAARIFGVADTKRIERFWSGVKRPAFGWPAGTYTGTYRLVRGGEMILEATRTIDLR